ncbi:MAG: c-type cytochrome [Chloroflexota bacterium]
MEQKNNHMARVHWLALPIVALLMVLAVACQPLQLPEGSMTSSEAPSAESTAESTEEMALGDPEAGAYVTAMVVGCGCHFNRDLGGLAGGNEFEGPWGIAYAPNLTSHSTGIADVSDEELMNALRLGHASSVLSGGEGGNLAQPMPRYSSMADEDVINLIAYLRSLDPIENEVPVRSITGEIPDTMVQEDPPATAPTEGADRGRYIATNARCGRCHTPRNDDGSMDWSRPLAGAPFRDTVAPNLTPDELTGLGGWSEEEIADFLKTGFYSDGTEAHGAMKAQTDRGLGRLTDDDALAIAAFLKSLPAIENLPQASE